MTTSTPESSGGGGSRPYRRALPTPSERNLRVHAAACLDGQKQAAVAEQFGLSQQRVSKICQQVEAWREAANPSDPAASDRRRVERQRLRQRLEQLWAWTAHEYERSRQPIVVERRGVRNGQTWSETTQRDSGRGEFWIRCAANISRLMLQFDLAASPDGDEARLAQFSAQAAELAQKMAEQKTAGGDQPSSNRTCCTCGKDAAEGDYQNGDQTCCTCGKGVAPDDQHRHPQPSATSAATPSGVATCAPRSELPAAVLARRRAFFGTEK